MNTLPCPVTFEEWFFGKAFADKLDAIEAAAKAKPKAKPKANPRDSWPESTDADVWELGPDREPEDTRDHAGASGPSASSAAFKLGFDLGLDREDAADPTDLGDELVRAFRDGLAAGRLEWDRRLDEMCGEAAYAVFSDGITDADIYRVGSTS